MRGSRFAALVVAVLLAVLVVCLACILAAWLWLKPIESAPTPPAVAPTPSRVLSTPTPLPPPPTPVTPGTLPPATVTATPWSLETPPTPLVVVDPSLTDRAVLEQQFQQARVGQQLVLLVHDDHVERELAAFLNTQTNLDYRNVTVRFLPGLVELGGEVRAMGLWIPATVRGPVTARDCLPEATITELEVGGFLTPRWVSDFVADLVYRELDRYPSDLPVCLEQIQVGEGEATISGYKR